MSIASEISRIRQNVEDSLSAVEDKGVTVPEGSNSDDLPGLIALIQAGAVVIDDTPDENGGIIRTITSGAIIKTQGKAGITPTEQSQTIVPDTGYTALSSVQINAIPGNYVGSTVTRKAAATYTPSETAQTIAAGQYLSGVQTISAVSSTYIGSDITRKSAATYTPGTTDQTIAAGQYLNGAQTIKGDANLVAANIASGVSIFGIQGTHSGGEGGDYTRTVIVPSQTVACTTNLMNNAYYAFLQNGSAPVVGSPYIVTYDGTEYVCEGYRGEANCITLGDIQVTTTRAAQYLECPFYVSYEQTGYYFVVRGSGTHIVKIERLDFVTDGTTLVPKTITANGTYDPEDDNADGYSEVVVSVPASAPNLQAKTNINPTESSQTIQADSGYDGLSSVQINAVSSTYVGSGITRRSGTDLTASGATVNVPAGYYAEAASKSVASGSTATPATTITANPTISVSSSGLITASVSGSQNVTPTVSAGYVSSGTAGTVSVSGSKTQQLTTKAAATITPGTTAQTIAAGTYLTGAQTIAGDSNLVSSNILSGKSIFGVQGGVTFQTYYTGSSNPANSLGVNGDIYLKT